MKEYALKTMDGETIKKVKANSLDGAVSILAQVKNLTNEALLSIFNVEKVS